MELDSIAADLWISDKTLRYYIGRYLRADSFEEDCLSIIGRVALLRKMGYSPLQISTIAECDCKICDLNPVSKRGQRRELYSAISNCNFSTLMYNDCAVAIQKMSLTVSTPWYDRMFWGRLIDFRSVIVAMTALFWCLLNRFRENGTEMVDALVLSILSSVFYAAACSVGDYYYLKANTKKLQGHQ